MLEDLTEPHARVEVKVCLVDVGDTEQEKENFVIEGISVDQKELVTGSYANFEVTVRNEGFKAANANVKLFIDGDPVGQKTAIKIDPKDTGKVSFRRTFRENEEGAHRARAVVEDNLTTDSTYYLGFKVRKGDMEAGWEEADIIYEHAYKVPQVQHVPLETHATVAQMDGNGKITLWSSSQSPFAQRNLIAKSLGISHSKLRVITPYVGGGFGSKA